MTNKIIQAKVQDVSPLTDSIMKLLLDPDQFIDYQAGQYLQIILAEEAYSFSIANAPLGSHKYELHIRHSANNPFTHALFAHIKEKGFVTLRLPFGMCSIDSFDAKKPLLFIAAGTGFAPVKAMIEQLLANGDSRFFELFWIARTQSDLYWDDQVKLWASHVKHFNYFSFLANGSKDALLASILEKHRQDLAQWQIVLCGPFDMAFNIRDVLVQYGALPEHLFSDAFGFE